MIDIESGKVIDLLPSREVQDVTDWLKTYPNLEVISRDGSLSYASAITQAHPEAIQVSDRFHILKNLTDAAKKYITKILKPKVEIEVLNSAGDSTNDYNDKNKEEKILKVKELNEQGYSSSKIGKLLNMDDRTVKKYIEIPDNNITKTVLDSKSILHQEKVQKKLDLISEVQSLNKKGLSQNLIAKELGIDRRTVKKYLSSGFKPTNGNYGTNRNSPLKKYESDIKKLLSQGYTLKKIEEQIREKGYNGSSSAIRMYTTRERRLLQEANLNKLQKVEFIERKWLIKLLYNPLDKVTAISKEQLNAIVTNHPEIGTIYDITHMFKETLFSRKVNELDKWIKEAMEVHSDEIKSFIGGIQRDIEAVKNAVRYGYNNGLAEGSVNKLKVIKRIMYGRNSFELLKSKLLKLESKRKKLSN